MYHWPGQSSKWGNPAWALTELAIFASWLSRTPCLKKNKATNRKPGVSMKTWLQRLLLGTSKVFSPSFRSRGGRTTMKRWGTFSSRHSKMQLVAKIAGLSLSLASSTLDSWHSRPTKCSVLVISSIKQWARWRIQRCFIYPILTSWST